MFIECFDSNKDKVVLNLSQAKTIEAFEDPNEEEFYKIGIVVNWNDDNEIDIFHGITYEEVLRIIGAKRLI